MGIVGGATRTLTPPTLAQPSTHATVTSGRSLIRSGDKPSAELGPARAIMCCTKKPDCSATLGSRGTSPDLSTSYVQAS